MSLNAPPAPTDLSWLYSGLWHLLEVLGLGGFGLAWRGNSRVTKLEEARGTLVERTAKLEEDKAAVTETLAIIRENVARLPTREELDRRFDDLKKDYRARRDS